MNCIYVVLFCGVSCHQWLSWLTLCCECLDTVAIFPCLSKKNGVALVINIYMICDLICRLVTQLCGWGEG